jgi:hypothetical protein
MNPEELKKAVDEMTLELIPELMPDYEEYLLWAKDKKNREAIGRNRIEPPPPEPKSLPEPEPEAGAMAEAGDTGAEWRPAWIGARRLNK